MEYGANKYLVTNQLESLHLNSFYKKLDGNSWKKYSNLEQELYSLDLGFHGSYKDMNGNS